MADRGRLRWFVPDGYLPAESSHGIESHEAACLLNVSDEEARVTFTFYFEDREPLGGIRLTLAAKRTRHVRLDRRDEPACFGRAAAKTRRRFAIKIGRAHV